MVKNDLKTEKTTVALDCTRKLDLTWLEEKWEILTKIREIGECVGNVGFLKMEKYDLKNWKI